MPGPVTMIDTNGNAVAVPAEAVAEAMNRGFSLESTAAATDRIAAEANQEFYGDSGGQVAAFGGGVLRGLTFGGSDVALGAIGGDAGRAELAAYRDANPGLSTAGNIIGALAPAAFTSGGSLAARGAIAGAERDAGSLIGGAISRDLFGGASAGERLFASTPAALTAKLGSKIAATGEGAGFLGRTAALAGAGATEGALQNAGAYISDIALGDRELSADGFVGAMGQGALWGGAAGGALSVGSGALTAARRLFPKQEMTRAAVATARADAVQAVTAATDDAKVLVDTARAKLRDRRAVLAQDPAIRAQLDEIAVNKAREIADAEVSAARSKAAEAGSKAEAAAARADKAKAPRKTRRAMQGDESTSAVSGDLPTFESVAAQDAVTTVDARALEKAGYRQTPGGGVDKVKLDKARGAIKGGQKDPIQVSVSPRGGYFVEDGRHRLQAAIESGSPIKVKWTKGSAGLDDAGEDVWAGAARAPTSAVPPDAATLLERQLAATKSGIDAGETLAQLNAKRALGKPTAVEDAVNAHLAKVDPEAAKLVRGIDDIEQSQLAIKSWLDKYGKGEVSKFERSQAARDTADSWRSKKAGYYSKTPEGEGIAKLPRGREWNWRGSEAERKAAEDAFYARQGGRESLEAQTRRIFPDGSEPVVAAKAERSLDDRLAEALGKRTDDIGEDISDTAAAVGRMEEAHAQLADDLGPAAPVSSQERAAKFREAERGSEASSVESSIRTTADAERAAATINQTGDVASAVRGAGRGAVDGALKVGDVIEALSLMGVAVPDVSRIPVVGPVLKAVLQARLVGKAFGRFGGKVPQTAETVVASKAAAVKQRIYSAVDGMLGATSKGMAKAAAVSGGPAAVLGHTLFDDRQPGERAPKASKDLAELFAMRSDELSRAMAPGAIHEAVRQRVRASDPGLVDAIAAGQERKLKFLYDRAPKPDAPDGLLAPKTTWAPSGSEIRTFSRLVAAADDPAGVLERVAKGAVVMSDEMDAVRTIYPTLYNDARARLVTKAVENAAQVPLARRLQLSLLFDLPLDGTMQPDYANFLQMSYQPPAPAPQAQAPMPSPTIAADVTIGQTANPYRI